MTFLPTEIIKKKRDGAELSRDEIQYMVDGFVSGAVPDYQMAAFLMAIYFKEMSVAESSHLTHIMLHSGRTLDFSDVKGLAVDKHSTGGVGDKTSMIIAPLVAACGASVPMIAGRGLGHTGGTLDKLESIPGFSVALTLEQYAKQVREIGVSIIGQTAEICPADKKIYALRDVTATIESYPLICASIMSKKIAEGIGALVLDVKQGSGAFMKTIEHAEILARKLMEIGEAHGKRVVTLITNMDQPLGCFIGNSLEIGECIAILRNQPFLDRQPSEFADTTELSLRLAGEMVFLSGFAKTPEEGFQAAREALISGRAWKKFNELCAAQGGDWNKLPQSQISATVLAESDGFVSALDTEQIGVAGLMIGAGRTRAEDVIDSTAGIEIHRKLGAVVQKGEKLFTIYGALSADDERVRKAQATLLRATTISLQKPRVPDLLAKRLDRP